MIPKVWSTRTTRNYNNIRLFNVKHEYFRNSFFQSTVIEWSELDNNIWNSESVSAFKKQVLKFIRPSPKSTFNVHNPHGIKLLTRLRVGLSHLREHKFRHNFQDSLDPFRSCGRHIETTIHFFLHRLNYSNQRKILFEKISNIKENACIIESTIEYIITTERFITPLLWIHLNKSPLFLKYLIDSGSPYVILFSCLVI